MRTHVSFRWTAGQPPTPGDLESLAKGALAEAGGGDVRIDDRGWARELTCEVGGVPLVVMAGFVGDEEREWLVFVEATRRRLRRPRNADDVTAAVCRALATALAGEPRAADVQWFTAEEWNDPSGGRGAPTP